MVNNVERVTSDPDVQEAVGGAIDTGVKAAAAGVELATNGVARAAEGVNTVAQVATDPVSGPNFLLHYTINLL